MSCPIEEQELDQALRNTRLGKSPGPDGILPEILVTSSESFPACPFQHLLGYRDNPIGLDRCEHRHIVQKR